MGRKILSVALDAVLPAICRDHRVAVRAIEALGMDPLAFSPPFLTCDGMPDDARIIGVRSDPVFTNTLEMVIESAEWPDVPAGYALPRVDVRMAHYANYQTYLKMTGMGMVSDGTYADAVGKRMDTPESAMLWPTTGRNPDLTKLATYTAMAAALNLPDKLEDFNALKAEPTPADPPPVPVKFREFF